MNLNPHRREALAGAAALSMMTTAGPTLGATTSTKVVETPHGKLRGYVDRGVNIFKGVRYGADTSGKNRFMPPRKPPSWAGVQDATHYGQQSPQLLIAGQLTPRWLSFTFPPPGGSATGEDCLVLNVWTPGLDNAKRPVIVWYHGGGYTVGSSHAPAYDGASLARTHGVVVVGVNHRLNSFGHTDLGAIVGGAYADAGNVGMIDCVAALEWVKASIDRFGGDPGKVMIFGESGGGGKVCNLLAMQSAKGLFHRAAIESGSLIRTGTRERTRPLAEAMLKELGLTKDTIGKIHDMTTAQIAAATTRVGATPLAQAFGPTIDGRSITRHPFDPDGPAVSADVPIICGYNRTEATLFAPENDPAFNMNEEMLKQRLSNLGDARDRVIASYRSIMPGASPADLYFVISTETGFAGSARKLCELKAAQRRAKAYHYRFDWATASEGGKWRSPHTIEIPYVFNNMHATGVEYAFGSSKATDELAHKVSGAWAAFARTGVPDFPGLPKWTPYDGATRATMLFNLDSRVVNNPLGPQLAVTPAVPSRF